MEQDEIDLRAQAAALRSHARPRPNGPDRKSRQGVWLALLAFVAACGLPVIGIPSLRHRLKTRYELLRAAYVDAASGVAPLMATVGENTDPFPEEYRRPQVIIPQFPKLLDMTATYPAGVVSQEAGASAGVKAPAAEETTPGSSEPVYRQGKIEQEAYDLLLKSNETIAGMVNGSDPTLQFKGWAAAALEQDSFLVRVSFVQAPDDVVKEYIWNVKLLSKEVVPLSAYARAISRP